MEVKLIGDFNAASTWENLENVEINCILTYVYYSNNITKSVSSIMQQ